MMSQLNFNNYGDMYLKPSLTPRIFPNTCMLSTVILQKAHIFCLGGALRNIFSLRIHALIISIPLCYFRGLVKKN